MRDTENVINDMLSVLRREKIAQVPQYAPFKYVRKTKSMVILERQNGNEATVPFSAIAKSIKAVRKDHSVYIAGPNKLREHGITHINSPVWSLIRILPLNKLID